MAEFGMMAKNKKIMADAKCVLATGISGGKYTAAAGAAFCALELAWKLTGNR